MLSVSHGVYGARAVLKFICLAFCGVTTTRYQYFLGKINSGELRDSIDEEMSSKNDRTFISWFWDLSRT